MISQDAVLGFILALATVVGVAAIREFVKRELWNPRLSLEYRQSPEFIVSTIETATGGFCREARYVRLKVQNVGHDVAKSCYGYLVNVERWDGRAYVGIGFHDTIPLCWSYLSRDATQKVEVLKGVPQYLDIFSARDLSPTITPRVATMPRVYADFFSNFTTGRLRFSIVVGAEGATPRRAFVELTWNRDWQNFKVDTTIIDEFSQ